MTNIEQKNSAKMANERDVVCPIPKKLTNWLVLLKMNQFIITVSSKENARAYTQNKQRDIKSRCRIADTSSFSWRLKILSNVKEIRSYIILRMNC